LPTPFVLSSRVLTPSWKAEVSLMIPTGSWPCFCPSPQSTSSRLVTASCRPRINMCEEETADVIHILYSRKYARHKFGGLLFCFVFFFVCLF
jgi:hypothetical protein